MGKFFSNPLRVPTQVASRTLKDGTKITVKTDGAKFRGFTRGDVVASANAEGGVLTVKTVEDAAVKDGGTSKFHNIEGDLTPDVWEQMLAAQTEKELADI
jgi:hypothetical protein